MPLPTVSSRHSNPSIAHSATPLPLPEEPGTFQEITPVPEPIPPGFTYASDVTSLGLGQSLQLLSFIPHAEYISVEIIQVWHIEPTPHETYWGIALALLSSSFGTPSHCSSLASLALPPCSLPSSFRAVSQCQGLLCQSSSSPLDRCILTAVSTTSHGEHTQNLSTDTSLRAPWTWGICLFLSILVNKIEEITTCAPDPAAPKSLLTALDFSLLLCKWIRVHLNLQRSWSLAPLRQDSHFARCMEENSIQNQVYKRIQVLEHEKFCSFI